MTRDQVGWMAGAGAGAMARVFLYLCLYSGHLAVPSILLWGSGWQLAQIVYS